LENTRLKVFRTVAAERSFRKAAELLHLSQPAVSQQVRALEAELGQRLFDRGGEGHTSVTLTDAGRVLLEYATRAAQLLAEAESALAALAGEHTGELRLAASTTIAQYILPRMLGAFLAGHPRVHPRVVSGNTERVVALVDAGEAALGMIEGPPQSRAVHTERFLRDTLVLIVPALQERQGRARRGPDDGAGGSMDLAGVARLPLLMRERGSGSRHVIERALSRAGLPPRRLQISMELDSTEAIVAGVEAGLGAGFVSEWAIGKAVRLGTVRALRVEGLEISRDLSLVWRVGPPLDGAAGAFARFAAAADVAAGPGRSG
jgi:DNA-binding transcriptional LysR family regulator